MILLSYDLASGVATITIDDGALQSEGRELVRPGYSEPRVLRRAVIGVYAGEEASVLYRRSPGEWLRAEQVAFLGAGPVALLGAGRHPRRHEPTRNMSGALHVSAGDILSYPLAGSGSETFAQRPWDATVSLDRCEAAVSAGRR